MYEYEIRNGVKATDIPQNYGISRGVSSYLRDEFGRPEYKEIIRVSMRTGKFGKSKRIRRIKNGEKMELSFQRRPITNEQ